MSSLTMTPILVPVSQRRKLRLELRQNLPKVTVKDWDSNPGLPAPEPGPVWSAMSPKHPRLVTVTDGGEFTGAGEED